MQLKVAIEYPLFADVLEYERHAVFEMPKLEEADEDEKEEPDRNDEEPENLARRSKIILSSSCPN